MLKTYEDTGKDRSAYLAQDINPQGQGKAFGESILPQEAPESQTIAGLAFFSLRSTIRQRRAL
jgi:hypothetical protein